MKILTAKSLKDWSGELSGKNMLPLLIRRLILATIDLDDIEHLHFPFGEEVHTGGYDGELTTKKGNLYVPQGKSVWEFGVSEQKKKKANDDYEKRKNNPLGKVPIENSYININTKGYTKKQEWANNRKKENFWKDVKYYDSIEIEHWLDIAPSVEFWLSSLLNKPHLGVRCADDYWRDWSVNPKNNLQLTTKTLTGGRKNQCQQLLAAINQSKRCQYVISSTNEESLGFILATLEELSGDHKMAIQSKTLVVDNSDDFVKLSEVSQDLILIPTFELSQVQVNRALNNNHSVVIPKSKSFISKDEDDINLPLVESRELNSGLTEMGIDEEKARLLSRNTGKNIAVLRRTLGFEYSKPKWLDTASVKDIIPLFFISRFNNSFQGDQEIITALTGKNPDDYIRFLKELHSGEESPLFNVNESWRLISHTDVLAYLAPVITDKDLNEFRDVIIKVLSEEDASFKVAPKGRQFLFNRSKNRKYSSELSQGLCETLVVLSVYADNFGVKTTINVESFVYGIVRDVLNNANDVVLRSLKSNLNLIAEASPTVFLNAVQEMIDDGRINTFYELEQGLFNSSNHLHHLLWALEQLAWMPENILAVCKILCQLENLLEVDLNSGNTPINSLTSIFRPWFPQTSLNFNERKQVLNSIKQDFPIIAFKIFESHLIDSSSFVLSGVRMRWRNFEEIHRVAATNIEVIEACNNAVDNLLDLSNDNTDLLCKLINELNKMTQEKVESVIESISNAPLVENVLLYNTIREVVGHHRMYKDAKWSLPTAKLNRLEKLASPFAPKDILIKDLYLFENDHPVSFDGGRRMNDYKEEEKKILKRRVRVINDVLKDRSIEQIIPIIIQVENLWFFAISLAHSKLTKSDELKLINLLESDNPKKKKLAKYYISAKSTLCSFQEIIKEYSTTVKKKKIDFQIDYLIALDSKLELWKYIEDNLDNEIEKGYWERFNQYFAYNMDTLMFGLTKLAEYHRTIMVFNSFNHSSGNLSQIPTIFILNLLENLKIKDFVQLPNSTVNPYGMRKVFKHLQNQDGLDLERLANLEYRYINIFDQYGMNEVKPKYLFKYIGQNPDSFIDFIKIVFKGETEEEIALPQLTKDELEIRRINGKVAFYILRNFNSIQGIDSSENLNLQLCNSWIDEVRRLGAESNRLGVVEGKIGEILARSNNLQTELGLEEIIYEIIERIKSKKLNRGFGIQMFNNSSFTSRPVGAGGTIEKDKSKFYLELSEKLKFTYPTVSEIYRELAEGYKQDAKDMDDSAYKDSLEY